MKQRPLLVVLSLLLLTCCIFSFATCSTTPSTKTPQKLSTPQVTLSDDTASWKSDTNAERFEISINGELSYLENSVTTKVLEDGQTFKIRAIGDGSNYSNSEWSNAVTYTAPAEPTPNYYTVVWKNGDTVLETDTDVPEGTTPEYNGSTPTKANHTFIGWTPEITSVTADVTYQAVFEENGNVDTYTVTFKDYDETVLKTQTVSSGSDATPPADPQRNGYRFTGWDKAFNNITSNLTMTAQYIQQFTVTFKDYNGNVLKTETVDSGASATPPNTPNRDGYTFASWNGVYTNVTSNQEVVATYMQNSPSITTYTVIFKDYDGTVLKTESVQSGTDATPPANPTRDGYTFAGWDGSYTNVTTNKEIVATYTENPPAVVTYTVVFKDYNGTVLKTVENVTSGSSVTAPADPARIGYRFTGWDKAFNNITSDLTITAQYIQQFTVTFKDYNGTVLKTETVDSGASAIPPSNPSRDGYEFKSWSGTYTNVTANQVVTATYDEIIVGDTYTVTFVDHDGTTVLGIDTVVSGGMADLPTNPTRSGYIFAGWHGVYENVTSDQTVQAHYISEDASNIFLIDSASAAAGETFTVELNLTGTVKLLTFDMCLYYDTSVLEVVSFDDQEVTINHLADEGMFVLNHSQDKNRTKDKYLTEITFRVKAGATVSSTEIYISDAKDIVYVNDGGTYSDADYELISGLVRIQ